MTPEAVADALVVAALGADLGRLAIVCRHVADQHGDVGRQRLLDCAAALGWAARLLAVLDAPKIDAEIRGAR